MKAFWGEVFSDSVHLVHESTNRTDTAWRKQQLLCSAAKDSYGMHATARAEAGTTASCQRTRPCLGMRMQVSN